MTSVPTTPPPPPGAPSHPLTLDVSDTTGIPFWRLTMAEFRKSYDTRAGMWLLITIGIVVGLVEAFILIATLATPDTGEDVYFTDFAMVAGGITNVLLPVLGILLVTGEWSQRSAMVSFALEPRRARVVAAKWLVGVCWVVVTIVVMLVIATVMTAILSMARPDTTHWIGYSGGTPHLPTFAIVQVLTMTTGFAFAALLLSTPTAIVLFFIYWYALPGVLVLIGSIRPWIGDALDWINVQAALSPVLDGTISTGEEWAKVFVSALFWIGIPLVAGVARILRAELK